MTIKMSVADEDFIQQRIMYTPLPSLCQTLLQHKQPSTPFCGNTLVVALSNYSTCSGILINTPWVGKVCGLNRRLSRCVSSPWTDPSQSNSCWSQTKTWAPPVSVCHISLSGPVFFCYFFSTSAVLSGPVLHETPKHISSSCLLSFAVFSLSHSFSASQNYSWMILSLSFHQRQRWAILNHPIVIFCCCSLKTDCVISSKTSGGGIFQHSQNQNSFLNR